MKGITLCCCSTICLFFGLFGPTQSFHKINRFVRSLPSVSDDHYSELLRDGTYKYAYTGENSYHAEKRLADGTVEGETLYVRPDGIPVKVHYFADSKGYRPKTEVLYNERVRSVEPTLYLAPPVEAVPVPVPVPVQTPGDGSIHARIEGNTVNINTGSGAGFRSAGNDADVAIASPTLTAIVGPGGRAELRPDTFARSGRNGIAISNPSSTAVVGPGGSVVLAPTARASTNSDPEIIAIPSPVEPTPLHARGVTTIFEPRPVHYVQSGGPTVVPAPIQSPDVLIVPSRPSYEYSYSYSAPDNSHPYRDNRLVISKGGISSLPLLWRPENHYHYHY